MKKLHLISEAQVRQWKKELSVHPDDFVTAEIFDFSKDDLLNESDVCELLGVTGRTLRKYRFSGHFHYIKLERRIIYLKRELYKDLLRLNNIEWESKHNERVEADSVSE